MRFLTTKAKSKEDSDLARIIIPTDSISCIIEDGGEVCIFRKDNGSFFKALESFDEIFTKLNNGNTENKNDRNRNTTD